MSNYEIITEIDKQQKIVNNANEKIAELIEQLQTVDDAEWDWLPVKKASELLKLSIPSVYRLIDSGKLEHKILCGKKFVKKSQILKL